METKVIQMLVCVSFMVASLIPQAKSAVIPGFTECMFNGRFYAVGESFHPVVNVLEKEYEAVCYNCTCQPTTIAQCEEIYCPPTECRAPIRLDGECCAVCIEPDINVGPKHCFYEGLGIPHGEVFHPPSMVQAFEEELERKRSQTNVTVSAKDVSVNPFCTQCECEDGIVQCEDVSSKCPSLTCSSDDAFLTNGNCCLECPTPPPRPVEGCADHFDGAIYTEGETWNPHYPGYGKVPCLNCTCINGQARCKKDPCPEVPFCKPDDHIPEIELCCLKCRPMPNTQATFPPPSTTEEGSTISTDRPEIIPEMTTTEVDISPRIVPCAKTDYIINIFKHPLLDSMALENTETRQVEVYTWNRTEEGVLMKEVISMTSFEFRERYSPSEYVFVGKTLQRRVNGLTTRESKRERIRRCTEACSSMVVNMLRPVTVDINCPEES